MQNHRVTSSPNHHHPPETAQAQKHYQTHTYTHTHSRFHPPRGVMSGAGSRNLRLGEQICRSGLLEISLHNVLRLPMSNLLGEARKGGFKELPLYLPLLHLLFQLLFLPSSAKAEPGSQVWPLWSTSFLVPSMNLPGTTTSSTHWTTLCQMRRLQGRVAPVDFLSLQVPRKIISDS